MIRTPENLARIRLTTSLMPASTASIEALPFLLKSLMPSSQMTAATPDSDSTSRSSRSLADGPPGNGCCGEYVAGPTTWLPPMPALTTAILLPQTALSRRASTSGQRSSPFIVEAAPSLIGSPKFDDRMGVGRRHVEHVQEVPGRGAERKRLLVSPSPLAQALVRALVNCLLPPSH